MSTPTEPRPQRRMRDLLAAASSASNGQRREGNELRPLGRKAARTRNQLLQAASACFVRSGYRSTTVQDIHQAAGVSLGTFYQYFSDKADLMATIVGESILRSSAQIFPPLDLGEGGASLRRAVEAFVRYYASTADFQGVWEEVTHFDHALAELRWELSSVIEASLCDIIDEEQQRGRIAADIDAAAAARSLSAMVDRYCYLTFVVERRRDPATLERSIDTLSVLWENALGSTRSKG